MKKILQEKRKAIGLDFQRLGIASNWVFIPAVIADVLDEDIVLVQEKSFARMIGECPAFHLRFLYSLWHTASS